MMGRFVYVGVLVAALIAIPERFRWKAKRRRRERLVAREPMSVEEIWGRWYRGTEVVTEDVEGVMAAVALDVGVSTSLLRPTDDLGKDLGLEGWELDDLSSSRVSLAIRKARTRGRKVKFKPFDTVDDAIRFSARLRS